MAALCNLGSLGVPVSVTLAIEKQFILHSIQRSMKLEYVLKQNLVETEGNIKIWWFPHSRNCISWRANKIVLNEKLQPHNLADLYAIAKNKLVIRTILQILHYFSVFVPKLIPMINICYFYLFYHREKQTTDYAHKIFTLSNLGQEKITTEWAIPMQNVELAVKTLKDLFLKENLKVQFPIELSYSKGDDVYLSPSFGRDTCWIAIHCFIPYGKIPTTKSIFVGFEKVMKYFGGRPSWRNDQIDTEKIEVSYPLLTDFKRIRDKLDPERLFFTELVEKIY
jgi:L-gulonolactone oxidase